MVIDRNMLFDVRKLMEVIMFPRHCSLIMAADIFIKIERKIQKMCLMAFREGNGIFVSTFVMSTINVGFYCGHSTKLMTVHSIMRILTHGNDLRNFYFYLSLTCILE